MKAAILTSMNLLCMLINLPAQVIEIRSEQPYLIYNDHVGNEWSFKYEVNDQLLEIDKPIQVSIAQAGSIKFVVFEANETYPDKGFVFCGLDPTNMVMSKEYFKDLEVMIKESNGKYAGNTAKWSVRVYFKKVLNRT